MPPSLAALAPMLIVFGAACVGVLVEAFAPRDARHPVQVGARPGRHRRRAGRHAAARTATHEVTAGGALAVDGPALFLQATIAGAGALAVLLIAERSLEPAVAFVAAAAVTAGSPRDRELLTSERAQTEVYPLTMFARRRHAAVRRGERPADHVRRARGVLAAAVPALRAGPPPPAALAGGGAQVLPARRVRLGVLPLRHRPGLRLRRQRRLRRHPRAPRSPAAATSCWCSGLALLAVGLLFKAGVAPFHVWTPDVYQGAPTPVTAFMAACTKVAAFGALLRVLYVGLRHQRVDWRPVICGVAILTMLVGAVLALTQTDIKRLLAYSSIANAGFLLVGVLGLSRRRRLGLSATMFYLVAYGFTTLAAFAVVTLVRDGDGEATHLSRWAGLARGRRCRRGD